MSYEAKCFFENITNKRKLVTVLKYKVAIVRNKVSVMRNKLANVRDKVTIKGKFIDR